MSEALKPAWIFAEDVEVMLAAMCLHQWTFGYDGGGHFWWVKCSQKVGRAERWWRFARFGEVMTFLQETYAAWRTRSEEARWIV